MISNPRIGQRVRLHYAAKWRPFAPHHGREGIVVARSRGPGPRNHVVNVDGVLVCIPCGQLQPVKIETAALSA
jgi:hypothetical protein